MKHSKLIKILNSNKNSKKGKCQKLWKCCREIRNQAANMIVGCNYTGFNTLTDKEEKWKCIKIAKDYNDNIMQQVILNTHVKLN